MPSRLPLTLLLALFAGTTLSAYGAEGYVCVVDHTVGFSIDKTTRQWNPTIFKSTEKLLITRASDDDAKDGFVWVIKEVGSSGSQFGCKADFNNVGFLLCQGFGEFKFNRKNKRFLSTYMFGYVTDALGERKLFGGGPEGSNTPSMAIGKCSPL